MEQLLEELAELQNTATFEGAKFAAGNNAAGTRLRAACQQIKAVSQSIRNEVTRIKNEKANG